MKSYGKKIAKEVRKNILLERAYDLLTYTALIAMGVGVAIVVFELTSLPAQASTVSVSLRIPCTNENHATSPVCKPVDVNQSHNGFYGTLANGEKWTQTWITRELMLFEGDQMRWLVYKGGVIYLDV